MARNFLLQLTQLASVAVAFIIWWFFVYDPRWDSGYAAKH